MQGGNPAWKPADSFQSCKTKLFHPKDAGCSTRCPPASLNSDQISHRAFKGKEPEQHPWQAARWGAASRVPQGSWGDCGATSPQGRVASSHGRKVLKKADRAGCSSAAGRESESPGLFCCQVISGSIKRCLGDAKSISSPIWMPSTLSHFLPNRYQPRSSLPNIALYSLLQLYKYFYNR